MISNAQLKAALKKYGGIPSLAAQDLGTSRQNVSQRIAKSPELQEYVAELEQTLIDAAEAVVAEAILKKDARMTRWFLDRKGKVRGWTTRVEHTGADGAPLPAPGVNVTITYSDAGSKDDVV